MIGLVALHACSFAPLPPLDNGDAGDDTDSEPDAEADGATPRRTRVVYVAGSSSASVLYSVDIVEGTPGEEQPLSVSTSNPSATVSPDVKISSDGSTILYASDARTEGITELYVVRFGDDGIPELPRLVSADHGGGDEVIQWWLTPDGRKAAYGWGPKAGFGVVDSYHVVDLETGSAPVTVSGGTMAAISGALSPDGRWFAFRENVSGVYAVDLSGGISTTVTVSAPIANRMVGSLAFSSAGKLAFPGDLTTDEMVELYVVDMTGSAPGTVRRASGNLASGSDVIVGGVGGTAELFSPDGKWADYLVRSSSDVDEVFQIDAAAAVPGDPQRLNGPLVPGGSVMDEAGLAPFLQYSPGSRWYFYRADERIDDVVELFLVDVSGTSPLPAQRISGPMVAGGAVEFGRFAPDDSGVAYVADQRVDGVTEAFYVDLRNAQPSAAFVINEDVPGTSDIGRDVLRPIDYVLAFSPDGDRVYYAIDQNVDDRYELMVSDVSTGTPTSPTAVQSVVTSTNAVSRPRFGVDGRAVFWVSGPASSSTNLWLRFDDEEPVRINAASGVTAFFVVD